MQQLFKQSCFSDEFRDEISLRVSDEIWGEFSMTNVLRRDHPLTYFEFDSVSIISASLTSGFEK